MRFYFGDDMFNSESSLDFLDTRFAHWRCKREEGEGGDRYLDLRCVDPLDPTFARPAGIFALAERVTGVFTIFGELNYRRDAIYVLPGAPMGARLMVRTAREGQVWTVSSPWYDSLVELYTRVRRGDLIPGVDFQAKQEEPHDLQCSYCMTPRADAPYLICEAGLSVSICLDCAERVGQAAKSLREMA